LKGILKIFGSKAKKVLLYSGRRIFLKNFFEKGGRNA